MLKHILLDVLVCSIAEYFYELCRILTRLQGVKIQTTSATPPPSLTLPYLFIYYNHVFFSQFFKLLSFEGFEVISNQLVILEI